MWTKVLIYVSTLFIAFAILFVSVLRTASVRYDIADIEGNTDIGSSDGVNIDYLLPFPGRVLPDNPLWFLKVLRDRIWLLITTNSTREAELKLLFADKRVSSAQILVQRGKIEEGLSTLAKAEKYLEEASLDEEAIRRRGIDTTEQLHRLTNASLKHYQIMQEIVQILPDDVKPLLIEMQEYPKNSYERGRNGLLDKGEKAPENPYEW